jgi:tripartite-type tricarboxylate transporter receptor subunit TctC
VYGSGGSGSPTNIQTEMFKKAANIDLTHVPYKGGGPANQDVLAGQIPLAMSDPSAVMQHIQVGTLRALAITSGTRWPSMSDVPTIAESGYPGFNHMTWFGILAPAGMAPATAQRLRDEVAKAVAAPDVIAQLDSQGMQPLASQPKEWHDYMLVELERYAKIIKDANIKPESD